MFVRLPNRSRPRRAALAVGVALAFHALFLGTIGLVTPQLRAPGFADAPTLRLSLLPPLVAATPDDRVEEAARPRATRAVAEAPSPLTGLAAPSVQITAAPSTPQAGSDFPGFYQGALPGCGREDLPLLSATERVRCRDQLEAELARRQARAADSDRARRLRDALARPVDGLPPEKRATTTRCRRRRPRSRNGPRPRTS